jgi:hypothetical protein
MQICKNTVLVSTVFFRLHVTYWSADERYFFIFVRYQVKCYRALQTGKASLGTQAFRVNAFPNLVPILF